MVDIHKLKQEYETLTKELSSPEVLKDKEKYTQLTKRFAFLEKIITMVNQKDNYIKQKEHLEEIISHPQEDEEMKNLAREELSILEKNISAIEEEIEDETFKESEPDRDIIVEIRAAAGGEEAALFSLDLFRMYSRYVEKKGWKLEVLSSHPTEIGGLKEIIFSVKGKGAFSQFKFESGVHRVQRVPVTESGGRIHTSTVTVAVLIEPKDAELKISPQDLKVETFRASGHGGQHVNVTDSAVRITHIPTAIVVSCQDERSQLKNRDKAMRVLKARIMEKMHREQMAKITENRRVQIGSGERSEKIRTYNFPERRVTDHRINFTLYRLEEVLDGQLEEIIKRLIKEERRKIYETKGLA